MPLNCPRNIPDYDACLDCRLRYENQCRANLPVSQNLADILTEEERISILENKRGTSVSIVTISHQDYQQLQRLILSLQEKIETHISATVGKKNKYKVYK